MMMNVNQLLAKRLAPPSAALKTASQRNTLVTSRSFASKSEAPKFDDMMAKAYARVAENHKHDQGPWKVMTRHAVSLTKGLSSPSILDLATGPGEPAKSIALALPHAEVIASDVSEDMVASASANLQHVENARCILADAQDLSEVESGSIDVVTCCYGYMFPTDKEMALKETHRVLKEGGHLLATTWDKLDIMKLNRDIMLDILEEEPPPPPLNPMSLSEVGLFQRLVEEAGFENVRQETSKYPFSFGLDREMQKTIGIMLIQNKINELAETDEHVVKKADESFWTNIGKYSRIGDNGEMIVPENVFRLTIARKG